ncbi:inner membrane protein [Lachnospiraceae bacterium]|nr:inner membrane protein [Lachnospiraceae bacterium]
MLGKTHFFVGTAAALVVMEPRTLPIMVAGTGAAALGGVISDVDSGTSVAHKDADKIIAVSVFIIGAVIVLEYFFHLGIYNRLERDSNIARILIGLMAFILVCAFGMQQPHRAFMHSFLAMALLTACVGIVFPAVAPYFAIGFASHLLVDVFNKKGEKLLWPYKKGFSFRLCSSHGTVNSLLMAGGMAVSALYFALSSPIHTAVGKVMTMISLK